MAQPPAVSETGDPLLLTPGPLTTWRAVRQAMPHGWGSRDAPPAHQPGSVRAHHGAGRRREQSRHRCWARSAITPFNHPLDMVAHKIAPAIATNNRIVVKSTALPPLIALALADMLYEAGLPPPMLSVVTGLPAASATR